MHAQFLLTETPSLPLLHQTPVHPSKLQLDITMKTPTGPTLTPTEQIPPSPGLPPCPAPTTGEAVEGEAAPAASGADSRGSNRTLLRSCSVIGQVTESCSASVVLPVKWGQGQLDKPGVRLDEVMPVKPPPTVHAQ